MLKESKPKSGIFAGKITSLVGEFQPCMTEWDVATSKNMNPKGKQCYSTTYVHRNKTHAIIIQPVNYHDLTN